MSFGKMNTFIEIISTTSSTDDEGFKQESETTLKTSRAYREGRHASEKWSNMATFTSASDLFRIRSIPNFKITTDMKIKCDDSLFEITSVENVKGRGMYLEILASEVKPGG